MSVNVLLWTQALKRQASCDTANIYAGNTTQLYPSNVSVLNIFVQITTVCRNNNC